MRRRLLGATLFALLILGLTSLAAADVKLPGVFGDHMVLQRETPVPVWGWADPGEKVTVILGEQSKTATADANGKWSLKLDPLKAGGPLVLKVQGKNSVERTDVLVGEVWLCSGQSNMAMTVGGVKDKQAEIDSADHPQIRMMTVARRPSADPKDDAAGDWQVSSPQTVAGFSAAAYFFGRELQQKLNVPVGLINSSWGGTPIQAWTSQKDQEADPELAPIVKSYLNAVATYTPEKAQADYEKKLANWEKARAKAKDEGKPFIARKPELSKEPGLSPNPGTLYNGMIAPLAPYAIRGAIWYQGEANAGNYKIYGLQMKTMIANWRTIWGEGDFPFLFVQLPNFVGGLAKGAEPAPAKPSENGWPWIREQFLRTLAVPNTGMAVTIDIGEPDDIHPKNKQDVGKRLAQWALAKTYGKEVAPSGPLYKSMRIDGGKIILEFDHVDGGLVVCGDKPKGFAIAGEDKKFVWADAKIEGKTVVVSSDEVKQPTAVRYAWANNPDCNLFNKAGLPASPFRTDDWAE